MSMLFDALEADYDRRFSDKELIIRYSKYLLHNKKYLILAMVGLFSGVIINLILPFTIQQGIDSLITENYDKVVNATIIFTILLVIGWFADYLRIYQNNMFTATSTSTMREELFERVQNHDLEFFNQQTTGFLMSRIMDDTQAIADFIKLTSDMLFNVLIAIFTFFILFFIDFYLALLSSTVIPLVIFIIYFFRRVARGLTRQWRIAVSNLNNSFAENISGVTVSKSFAKTDRSIREFDNLNQEHYRINTKKQMFFSSIFPFVFALSNVGIFLVLYYGGISAIETGTPSSGTIVLFIIMLQRFYFPIMFITTFYNHLQAGLAATERIFSLQDVVSKVENTGREVLNKPKGDIEFKNLTFTYDGRNPVFENFNLRIKAGESVAIVGHTGAGKSTLLSLLARFYEVTKGQILFDGKDIRSYDIHTYRNAFGIVLQDPLLFSGTIRKNITYGKPDASDEDILKVAKLTNSYDFIKKFPDGLNSILLERGIGLSQGQRQLLSLTRALLIDPEVLLLDEATASIDPYSEALIQEALDNIFANRSTIIIAHRLTTVKKVDRIIVLDNGKIVEEGNHNELLDLNGYYSELYRKYFEFQKVEV
jgi:ABC-type multidrug transport system fused ATPase/permease subunit